jgi:hypothetical protein
MFMCAVCLSLVLGVFFSQLYSFNAVLLFVYGPDVRLCSCSCVPCGCVGGTCIGLFYCE